MKVRLSIRPPAVSLEDCFRILEALQLHDIGGFETNAELILDRHNQLKVPHGVPGSGLIRLE
jgi:hypothetical protein